MHLMKEVRGRELEGNDKKGATYLGKSLVSIAYQSRLPRELTGEGVLYSGLLKVRGTLIAEVK